MRGPAGAVQNQGDDVCGRRRLDSGGVARHIPARWKGRIKVNDRRIKLWPRKLRDGLAESSDLILISFRVARGFFLFGAADGLIEPPARFIERFLDRSQRAVSLGHLPVQPRDFAVVSLAEQDEPETERQRNQKRRREREGRAGGGDERGDASPK